MLLVFVCLYSLSALVARLHHDFQKGNFPPIITCRNTLQVAHSLRAAMKPKLGKKSSVPAGRPSAAAAEPEPEPPVERPAAEGETVLVELVLQRKKGVLGVAIRDDTLITEVDPDSGGEAAGLLAGDFIMQLNAVDVGTYGEMLPLLKRLTGDTALSCVVRRAADKEAARLAAAAQQMEADTAKAAAGAAAAKEEDAAADAAMAAAAAEAAAEAEAARKAAAERAAAEAEKLAAETAAAEELAAVKAAEEQAAAAKAAMEKAAAELAAAEKLAADEAAAEAALKETAAKQEAAEKAAGAKKAAAAAAASKKFAAKAAEADKAAAVAAAEAGKAAAEAAEAEKAEADKAAAAAVAAVEKATAEATKAEAADKVATSEAAASAEAAGVSAEAAVAAAMAAVAAAAAEANDKAPPAKKNGSAVAVAVAVTAKPQLSAKSASFKDKMAVSLAGFSVSSRAAVERAASTGGLACCVQPRAGLGRQLSFTRRPKPKNQPLSGDEAKREFVRAELAAVPIFHGVSAETFERMLSLVDVDEVDVVGHDIIKLGSVPSHLCILVHGNVDVILSNGLCVAKLTAHAAEAHNSYPFFGEMGLLANKPAMANVRASSACKVLTVSRASFPRFLNLVPDFEERLKAIAETRRKQDELLSKKTPANKHACGAYSQ